MFLFHICYLIRDFFLRDSKHNGHIVNVNSTIR